MPELIEAPVRVEAAGEPPKLIDEFAGRASNSEQRVSVARMRSPAGWSEPGQRPEFDEYTIVLGGALLVFIYIGRLFDFITPGDYVSLIPPIVYGFLVHPLLYGWIGLTFIRRREETVGS